MLDWKLRGYRRAPSGSMGGTAPAALVTPFTETFNRRRVGEQGLFMRVMEPVLATQRLCQKIWFWHIALLPDKHSYRPASVNHQHFGFIRRLGELHVFDPSKIKENLVKKYETKLVAREKLKSVDRSQSWRERWKLRKTRESGVKSRFANWG